MLNEIHMPKKKEIYFPYLIYYTFSSNSNFTLKICEVLWNNVEMSPAKNDENLSMKL